MEVNRFCCFKLGGSICKRLMTDATAERHKLKEIEPMLYKMRFHACRVDVIGDPEMVLTRRVCGVKRPLSLQSGDAIRMYYKLRQRGCNICR